MLATVSKIGRTKGRPVVVVAAAVVVVVVVVVTGGFCAGLPGRRQIIENSLTNVMMKYTL